MSKSEIILENLGWTDPYGFVDFLLYIIIDFILDFMQRAKKYWRISWKEHQHIIYVNKKYISGEGKLINKKISLKIITHDYKNIVHS